MCVKDGESMSEPNEKNPWKVSTIEQQLGGKTVNPEMKCRKISGQQQKIKKNPQNK